LYSIIQVNGFIPVVVARTFAKFLDPIGAPCFFTFENFQIFVKFFTF
jgi:hypothetical protein